MRIEKNKEVSERLRERIDEMYPARGRFGQLEAISGITSGRWRNFFYRKQEAAFDMINFWCDKYPSDKSWLLTGKFNEICSDYPFLNRPPVMHENQSIAERLTWVIYEWAGQSAESLFKYLEHKSNKEVSQAEWAKLIIENAEPSMKMLILVAKYRPIFIEWILTGGVTNFPQVDPSNAESVAAWIQVKEESFGINDLKE